MRLTTWSRVCCNPVRGTWVLVALLALSGSAVGRANEVTENARTYPAWLRPCEIPGVPPQAFRGTFEVWENRAAQAGRKIGLNVVVVAATGKERAPDALFYISGGPGDPATESAGMVAAELASVRARRDFVFIDQRGSGGSHPLNIDLYGPPTNLQSYLGDAFPVDAVRKARATLESDADLTLYTTPIAMDDLDEVRAALGYERIDLYGTSYGTRAAMIYMRSHPDRVRAVVMEGVDPVNDPVPLHFPKAAQRALDGIIEECSGDPSCHAAFPNLAGELTQVLDKLSSGPASARILHPVTGDVVTVTLSRNALIEALRYLMYNASTAGHIPSLIHEAAQGRFEALAEMALFGRMRVIGKIGMGMYLSIICAEDLPQIQPGEGEREAAGTYLGEYALRQRRAACDCWARAPIPSSYSEPVVSDAPVLLLSGALDPVTPPSNGDEVAKHLKNSLHIVVPHGGHSYEGLVGAECVNKLLCDFIERADPKALDTACVATVKRGPFVVTPPQVAVIELSDAEMAKFAGTYNGEKEPVQLTLQTVGQRLKITMPGDRSFLLAPVSSTRFRVVGLPGLFLDFQVDKGRVARATLIEGGVETLSIIPASAGK